MTPLDRVLADLAWLPPAYLRLHLELPQARTNPGAHVRTSRERTAP